jgi:hypothetical protein
MTMTATDDMASAFARSKRVAECEVAFTLATKRMEREANAVIGRLIVHGYASKRDVKRLRECDKACRSTLAELQRAKGAVRDEA